MEHKEPSVGDREGKKNKNQSWRSSYLLVLGVKAKDMLIEHINGDQLYEINGPKNKYSSLLQLASILKIVKMC